MPKIIRVKREDTECDSLTILKYRNEEGTDGILFVAWHYREDRAIMQEYFLQIDESMIVSFINDYTQDSAQRFVDNFSF